MEAGACQLRNLREKEVEKWLNYCQPVDRGVSKPGLEQDRLCWRLLITGDVNGHRYLALAWAPSFILGGGL